MCTGTLLMAIAERVRDLVNREGGMDGLEKTLIEEVLHGYDTNLTATHLAATTLGLLSPGTEFAKMNIERTFLGVNDNGHASLALWNLFTADNHTCWAGRPAVGNTLTAQILQALKLPNLTSSL